MGLLIIQFYLSAQRVCFCPALDILIEDNQEAKVGVSACGGVAAAAFNETTVKVFNEFRFSARRRTMSNTHNAWLHSKKIEWN